MTDIFAASTRKRPHRKHDAEHGKDRGGDIADRL
jgi:hypothetical protein